MSSNPPPPPPPEGFEGVYPARTSASKGSLWSIARGIADKAKDIDKQYQLSMAAGQKLEEAKKSMAEKAEEAKKSIAEKAKEIDEQYKVSSTASAKIEDAKTTAAAKIEEAKQHAKQSTSSALESLKAGTSRHAASARDTVVQKCATMTPEQRERWAAGAVSVLSIASAVGGKKTKTAAAFAGATATAIGKLAIDAEIPAGTPAPRAAAYGECADVPAASAAGQPPDVSDASEELREVLVLDIVATVGAGSDMCVHVEGAGDYEVRSDDGMRRADRNPSQCALLSLPLTVHNAPTAQVTVPAGVRPGETFSFEIEAPVNTPMTSEAVPLGLPAHDASASGGMAFEPAVPLGLAAYDHVPMGLPVEAASIARGSHAAAAPLPPPPPLPPMASRPSNAPASMNVNAASSRAHPSSSYAPCPSSSMGELASMASTVSAASSLARELGVTPQQALSASKQGAQLAKDLGVTPQQALNAGKQGVQLAKDLGVTKEQAMGAAMGAAKFLAAVSNSSARNKGPGL